jgi:hypothetical protein
MTFLATMMVIVMATTRADGDGDYDDEDGGTGSLERRTGQGREYIGPAPVF